MTPTNCNTTENLTIVDFKSLCNWNSWWYNAIPVAIRPQVKIIIMYFLWEDNFIYRRQMDNSMVDVVCILLLWYLWKVKIQVKNTVEKCRRIMIENEKSLKPFLRFKAQSIIMYILISHFIKLMLTI